MKTSKPLRVLIVDDDPVVCRLVKAMLESIGHEVVGVAVDGHQAVARAAALAPGVILMDVSMPGMDGLEATRQIQAVCPVPVVLLTALDDLELVERAGEAGVGAYVVKPPRVPELARAISIAAARFSDWMKLRRLNEDLGRALAQVKRLRGLLPICAHCKKIRDDAGYWHGVEVYIKEHTGAEFTHGVCDECQKVLYPGI